MIEGTASRRAAIVAEAMSWIGTPWHHAARVKGAGVDCGQLIAAVFEAVGLTGPLTIAPYPQDFMLHNNREMFREYVEAGGARKVPDGVRPGPGDICLFRFGRVISHAAIVTTFPEVVHSYVDTRRVTVDDVERNPRLRERYVGAWTIFEEGAECQDC